MSVQLPLLDNPCPPPVPLPELLAKNTACARLATLFLARRGQWIDGLKLGEVAGAYAWRSRVAELRGAPWFLDIRNQVRRAPGKGRKISEYRLVA